MINYYSWIRSHGILFVLLRYYHGVFITRYPPRIEIIWSCDFYKKEWATILLTFKKNFFLANIYYNIVFRHFCLNYQFPVGLDMDVALLAEVIYSKLISTLTKCHGSVIFAKTKRRKTCFSCSVPFYLLKYRPIFRIWKQNYRLLRFVLTRFFCEYITLFQKIPSMYLQDVQLFTNNSMENGLN